MTLELHRGPRVLPGRTLVSVCIAAFNQGNYIEAAIDSALRQTYEPIEVIVVDDASSDDTVQRARACSDPRIHVWRNDHNVGQSINRNRTIARASGSLVKFLDADDLLDPRCVEKMVAMFAHDSTVGLVFCRRGFALEANESAAEQWLAEYGELHRRFVGLKSVTDGRWLLEQWLAAGLHDNRLGEPSAVMVTRSHLDRSGGFGYRVRLTVDADLWVRLLARCRVGFVDEELICYRHGHGSVTREVGGSRRNWTDRLWTLEALNDDEEVRSTFPRVPELLKRERRQAWRTAARFGHVRNGGTVPVGPYLSYIGVRALRRLGLGPPLYPRVVDEVDCGASAR